MSFQVAWPWPMLLLIVVLLPTAATAAADTPATVLFNDNYEPTYGADGYHLVNHGAEISITMDQSTGAGFKSKSMYESGFFQMRIKIPAGYTAGVVTAYYLVSDPPDTGVQDEVDFEFLGDKDGKPITLQTNLFIAGHGDREQRLHLWFDPAADFHDYKILWNPYQLVMFVDETPVRVVRNETRLQQGAGREFPAKAMRVRGSVWDGSEWATDGGRSKVDWGRAPFTAGYRGFGVDGCDVGGEAGGDCGSPDLWWNGEEYRGLTAAQQAAYESVKRNMTYDYCTAARTGGMNEPHPECS